MAEKGKGEETRRGGEVGRTPVKRDRARNTNAERLDGLQGKLERGEKAARSKWNGKGKKINSIKKHHGRSV